MLSTIQKIAHNFSEGSQRALNSNAGKLAVKVTTTALDYGSAALGFPPVGEFLNILITHGTKDKSSCEPQNQAESTSSPAAAAPAAVAVAIQSNSIKDTAALRGIQAERFADSIVFTGNLNPDNTNNQQFTGIASTHDLQTGAILDNPKIINSYDDLFETNANKLALVLNQYVNSGKPLNKTMQRMFKVLENIEAMMDQKSLITTHHEATLANIKRTINNYKEEHGNNIDNFKPAPALVTV